MRAGRIIGVVALLLVVAVVFGLRWKWGEPRRLALQSLSQLDTALRTGNSTDLLKLTCTPAAIRGRTAPEQAQFLTKALADEISPEGLAVLRKEGAFGPLTNIFPAEADAWAKQAGVRVEDCVAFKLERNGLRAEVVLARPPTLGSLPGQGEDAGGRPPTGETTARIVRCNNVKQLAEKQLSTIN
jgi:hypothetical protein